MKMMQGAALRLLEEIASAGSTDANEHFDEFGTRYREEGDTSFASNRAGKQCLAGSGRADEENPFRSAGAEAAKGFWILEKGDGFLSKDPRGNNLGRGFADI